jgi:hypothetical protein
MNFHLDAPNFGRMSSTRTVLAASNEDTTLTAAQSCEAIVTMTPAASDKTITTATAAAIVSLLGDGVVVGSCFELTIVNVASATRAITFAGGSGVTIGGAAAAATVAAATSATYIGRVTNVATAAVTFYRKGG